MDIRVGKYQKEDGTFQDSFYEMISDFEKRLHYAAENTDLPEEPDMKRVQELVMTINERVVRMEALQGNQSQKNELPKNEVLSFDRTTCTASANLAD